MSRVLAALLTLAKNAVPAAGVLLLYLGENVVMVLLAAMTFRLVLPASKSRTDALKTFFLVAIPFTFGAAVITSAVILIRAEYRVAPRELAGGLAAMANRPRGSPRGTIHWLSDPSGPRMNVPLK